SDWEHDDAGAGLLEPFAIPRQDGDIRVDEWDDQIDLLRSHDLRQDLHVGWIGERRDEMETIRLPDRGSERIGVGDDDVAIDAQVCIRAPEGAQQLDPSSRAGEEQVHRRSDRKSTRLNSSHQIISY